MVDTGLAIDAVLRREKAVPTSVAGSVAVPHARVQSMKVMQGPWDARRDLAAVSLVSTPGPIGIVIPHLSLHDAEAFLDAEPQRTSAARRSEGTPCANPAPGDGLSSVDIALTDGHRP